MPNQFLPQLPPLLNSRPAWARPDMSAETIADIRSRPDQLRRYKSGMVNQIQFTGSLMPQPPNNTSGVVYAGGQPPDAGGYVAPQGIPGTASNWTVDNPNPNTPRPPGTPIDGPGGANVPDVQARTPWFSQPWGAASQESELPYWMKGQNGRR